MLFCSDKLMTISLSNAGCSLLVRGTNYEAKAHIEALNAINLNPITRFKKFFTRVNDANNFVDVVFLGKLSKHGKVTKSIKSAAVSVSPVILSVDRAAIVDTFNFLKEMMSHFPTPSDIKKPAALASSKNRAVRFCVLHLTVSELSIQVKYKDDHIKGDGFEKLVGKSCKFFLRYFVPFILNSRTISLPQFNSKSCYMFQHLGQLVELIRRYYIGRFLMFWKKFN